jgi:hypothetical protein
MKIAEIIVCLIIIAIGIIGGLTLPYDSNGSMDEQN